MGNQDPEFMFITPLLSIVNLLILELYKNGFILLHFALFTHFVSSSLLIHVATVLCCLVGHLTSIEEFIYPFSC